MLTLKILFVCQLCLFGSYELARRVFGYKQELLEHLKFLAIVLAVLICTKSLILIYLVIFIYYFKYLADKPEHLLPVAVVGVFALPDLVHTFYLPGGMKLITLSMPVILVTLFGFSRFAGVKQDAVPPTNVDKFALAFCVLSLMLDARAAENITQLVRGILNQMLLIWVPYYILSSCYRQVPSICRALAFASIVGAAFMVVEWLLVFKMFDHLLRFVDMVSSGRSAYYFRGLGLRVSGVKLNSTVAAGLMASGFMFIYFCSNKNPGAKLFLIIALALTMMALLFTDTRAALLAVGVGAGAAAIYWKPSMGWRFLCYATALCLVATLLINYGKIVDAMGGSWKYRADLITYSADAFSRAPLFGAHDFRSNEVLVANMTQGQGIIDMVNVYLMLTLRYGLVGLALFLLTVFFAIKGVHLELLRRQREKGPVFSVGLALLSGLSALLFFLYSASLMGAINYGFWYFVAIISAYLKSCRLNIHADQA